MAFKHQTESFRTRDGLRYECDGDICDASLGVLRLQARSRVQELRKQGRKAFAERHTDGFYRVFATAA